MKIRRSIGEEIVSDNGCDYSALLLLNGVESEPTDVMQEGTEKHKQIEDSLKKGIIPENIKFALKNINAKDILSEHEIIIDIATDLQFSCTIDGLILKNNKAVIFDWKFAAKEEFVINDYRYKWVQPLWYAYLVFVKYPEIEKILFQFVLPNSKDVIEPHNYSYFEKDVCFELMQNRIIVKILDFLQKNKNNIFPNFQRCSTCLEKKHCEYMNLDNLKRQSDITLNPEFKLTQKNVGDVYNLMKKLNSACDILKKNIKESMLNGEIKTFNVSDNKCIDIVEIKGRKSLDKDSLNEFLKDYNKTCDDFMKVGKSSKQLKQLNIKKKV